MNGPLVCAIGTTDPWNAAGLGLDVLALAECGARALIVVAGVSAQDARGVHAAAATSPELIGAQFEALREAPIAAYRIGAVLDVPSAEAIARAVSQDAAPVVYDPVFAPSGGGSFVDDDVVGAIARSLLPCARVVTPNVDELARLLGGPVAGTPDEMSAAARALVARGVRAVLVTGGHLSGPHAIDVLADGDTVSVFASPRLTASMRGTGCLLAGAIAAGLARGEALVPAVVAARAFVQSKLAHATTRGSMQTAY